MVKNLPAVQETQETPVQSLGQEDPQEEGKAMHSSILAWRILWTEEPGAYTAHGVAKSQTRLKRLNTGLKNVSPGVLVPRVSILVLN